MDAKKDERVSLCATQTVTKRAATQSTEGILKEQKDQYPLIVAHLQLFSMNSFVYSLCYQPRIQMRS